MTSDESLERIAKLLEFHVIGHSSAYVIPKAMTPKVLARMDRLRDELWGKIEDHRPDLRTVKHHD